MKLYNQLHICHSGLMILESLVSAGNRSSCWICDIHDDTIPAPNHITNTLLIFNKIITQNRIPSENSPMSSNSVTCLTHIITKVKPFEPFAKPSYSWPIIEIKLKPWESKGLDMAKDDLTNRTHSRKIGYYASCTLEQLHV